MCFVWSLREIFGVLRLCVPSAIDASEGGKRSARRCKAVEYRPMVMLPVPFACVLQQGFRHHPRLGDREDWIDIIFR